MSYTRLGAIAERQYGLFTHDQALMAEFTEGEIRRNLDTGEWATDRRGVYVVNGAPHSYERALLAAVLGSPDGTMISGPSAAVLATFPKAHADHIHVMTDECSHARLAGVVGHRSRLIVPADRAVVRRIPTTSPARVIVDCSADPLLAGLCGWWMDHGLREQWFRLDELRHTIDRMRPGPGRDLGRLRKELAKRQPGYQPGDSQPEVRIAHWLEAAGFGRPELNAPIQIGKHKFEVDGLYRPDRVGFEYQSWKIHGAGQRRPFVRDAARLSLLTGAGYEIHLFTDETTEAEAVETVGMSLRRRRD